MRIQGLLFPSTILSVNRRTSRYIVQASNNPKLHLHECERYVVGVRPVLILTRGVNLLGDTVSTSTCTSWFRFFFLLAMDLEIYFGVAGLVARPRGAKD